MIALDAAANRPPRVVDGATAAAAAAADDDDDDDDDVSVDGDGERRFTCLWLERCALQLPKWAYNSNLDILYKAVTALYKIF